MDNDLGIKDVVSNLRPGSQTKLNLAEILSLRNLEFTEICQKFYITDFQEENLHNKKVVIHLVYADIHIITI